MGMSKTLSKQTMTILLLTFIALLIASTALRLMSRFCVNVSGLGLLKSKGKQTQSILIPDISGRLPVVCQPTIASTERSSIRWANRAVILDNISPIGYRMTGSTHLAACLLDEAERAFVYANGTSDSVSTVALGTVALYNQDVSLAINAWERADAAQCLLDLGTAALNTQKWGQAESAYSAALRVLNERAVQDSPLSRAVALRGKGYALYNQNKDFQQAVAMLQQAFELEQDSLFTHVLLGDIYYDEGKLASARSWYTSANVLFPNHWLPMSRLGRLANAAGKPQEAVRWYTLVIEANPNIEHAYVSLGDTYVQIGETEAARKVFETGALRFGSNVFSDRLKALSRQ